MVSPKMVKLLESRQDSISANRKEKLTLISEAIVSSIANEGQAVVQFVCTHNSRRSQAAEFLLDILARKFRIPITAISAGTESTAFNERMVSALESYGYPLIRYGLDKNPLYIYQENFQDLYYYSKSYSEELVVYDNKIVVTVCDDASENCPVIPGTYERFHLNYKDPKHSDNTPEEKETYRNKIIEIGTEMYFLTSQMKSQRNIF